MDSTSRLVRGIWCVVAVMVAVLQYRLWIGEDSLVHAWALQSQIERQQVVNTRAAERNARLEAEVTDLKSAREAIEEQARAQLGLIHNGETFYLVTRAR